MNTYYIFNKCVYINYIYYLIPSEILIVFRTDKIENHCNMKAANVLITTCSNPNTNKISIEMFDSCDSRIGLGYYIIYIS